MSFGELDGDRILPRDVVGHLLLVWAIEYIENAPGQYSASGPGDAVAVDVVDLDQTDDEGQPGLVGRNVWWRPGKLIQALKRRVGNPEPVLAYMTIGAAVPGRTPPFVLLAAHRDPVCAARGKDWLAAHPDFEPTKAWTPPAPTQPQYIQPPAAPIGQPAVTSLPPPPPAATESALERLARQAAAGAARIPRPRDDEEQPPF